MRYYKFVLIALLVIFLDQASKLWVYANMHLGEEFVLFNVKGLQWLKIHYTLNPGMAFGVHLPAPFGKILLSLFRIVAVVLITIYLKRLIDKQAHWGLLVSLTLIIAGALGNVLDSMFYGIFLKNNLPPDAPFAFLHGQVIDMIFTDFWQGILPEWIPFLGGTYFAFPIFNIADSSIFVGVVSIILFQRKFFPKTETSQEAIPAETSAENKIADA
ncbi:MAG: lipoprotein signal peptidase [Raineya sp.]|nr:lipoprotein signal peptidase [Raineya sp.]MDW8295607.1 lipoprotein signal peptidase [Raineya sp.]